jgi:hypothetical protein
MRGEGATGRILPSKAHLLPMKPHILKVYSAMNYSMDSTIDGVSVLKIQSPLHKLPAVNPAFAR